MAKAKPIPPADVPVTRAVLAKAVDRGARRKESGVRASGLRYLPGPQVMMISFRDGSAVALPVKNYPELRELGPSRLRRIELGMAGSALCLEEADLHVSIAGLVAASAPLRRMAISVAASRGGARTSEAKAAAARANGKKGGRPPKRAGAA